MQILEGQWDVPAGAVFLTDAVRDGTDFGEGDAVAETNFKEGGAFHGLDIRFNAAVSGFQRRDGIARCLRQCGEQGWRRRIDQHFIGLTAV